MLKVVASLSCVCVFLLSGCSNGIGVETQTAVNPAVRGLRGTVHGGQPPVTGATITLWAVGGNGYGSAATSLATTTTDSNGTFNITGTYICPGNDPEVYITATGGNPGLGTGTNNTAIYLMAALTDCNTLNANAQTVGVTININEVTTVASMYALKQFVRPATLSIGSFSANNQGLVNAFAMVGNLVNISTGTALATTPNGNGIVPQAELNTVADILAPCVNSSSSTSSACASLFGAVKQVNGSAPTNTMLAAYSLTLYPGYNASPSTALFGLVGSTPPFVPTLSAVPNDWTLALSFATGGTRPSGLAIDSAGRVWIANFNSGGGTSSISMISPTGVPAGNSPFSNSTLIYGANALAIDTNNNVWVANGGNSSAEELNIFTSSGTTYIGTANGPYNGIGLSSPQGVAVDNSNNIWFSNAGNNSVTELLAGSNFSSTTYTDSSLSEPLGIATDVYGNTWVANHTGASVTEIGNGNISHYSGGGINSPQALAIDGTFHLWVTDAGLGEVAELSDLTGADVSTSSGFSGGGLTASYGAAIDGFGNLWATDLTGNSITEIGGSSGVPFTGSTGYQGGSLSHPNSIAIDGAGDIWVTNNIPTNGQTVTEFVGVTAPASTLAQAVGQGTIGVRPGTLNISPSSTGTWHVGTFNSQIYYATGGVGTYTYSITSGLSALQGIGLSFTAGGTLSGTPTGTGTFPYTVQVQDSSLATATLSATLQVDAAIPTVCSQDGSGNSLLKGNYAFLLSGFNPSGHFYDEIGDFVADGAGNISSGNADANGDQNIGNFSSGEVQYGFSGTYSIGSTDNRGIMTVSNTNSGTPGTGLPSSTSYCFVADTVAPVTGLGTVAQSGRIVQADGSGFMLTGYFEIQDSADFTDAALANSYAFGMQGVDGTTPNRRGVIGQFALNNSGGVNSGQLDVSSTNCCQTNNYSAANAVTSSGSSYTVAASGRGTLTLNLGGTPLTFVTYVASTGNTLLIMSSDASASGNTPLLVGLANQQTTTNFTTTNVQAAGAFRATADTFDNSTNPATVYDKVTVGQLTFDGSGNATFTADENSGGSVSTPADNNGTGTYTVTSSGYLTITPTGGSGSLYFYLYAPGAGFGLDTNPGVDAYYMLAQTIPSGGFTTANLSTYLSGSYGIGTLLPGAYNISSSLLQNNDQYPSIFSGTASFNTGTLSIVQDQVEAPGNPASSYVYADQSSAGTYALDPTYGPTTGRFLITVGGQTSVAGYVVNSTTAFALTLQSGQNPQLVEADHQ